MTSSNKCRPDNGRSKTRVRENSACQDGHFVIESCFVILPCKRIGQFPWPFMRQRLDLGFVRIGERLTGIDIELFVNTECIELLLRFADRQNPFLLGKSCQIFLRNLIFTLPLGKRNNVHALLFGEIMDVSNKGLCHRTHQSRRYHLGSPVFFPEKVAIPPPVRSIGWYGFGYIRTIPSTSKTTLSSNNSPMVCFIMVTDFG